MAAKPNGNTSSNAGRPSLRPTHNSHYVVRSVDVLRFGSVRIERVPVRGRFRILAPEAARPLLNVHAHVHHTVWRSEVAKAHRQGGSRVPNDSREVVVVCPRPNLAVSA